MKRPEKIGTRRLTRRSLRAAFNEARVAKDGAYNPKEDWLHDQAQGPEKWPAIEAVLREVERHVTTHQMRQVYALAVKQLGKKAADKLRRAWTIPENVK